MTTVEARGANARVCVDEEWLTIRPTRLGVLAGRSRGVRVQLRTVAGIQFQPTITGVGGFIRFVMPGSPAFLARQAASRDPYTIFFSGRYQAAFETVRDAALGALAAFEAPRWSTVGILPMC